MPNPLSEIQIADLTTRMVNIQNDDRAIREAERKVIDAQHEYADLQDAKDDGLGELQKDMVMTFLLSDEFTRVPFKLTRHNLEEICVDSDWIGDFPRLVQLARLICSYGIGVHVLNESEERNDIYSFSLPRCIHRLTAREMTESELVLRDAPNIQVLVPIDNADCRIMILMRCRNEKQMIAFRDKAAITIEGL
jgi:hypothetical protein